LAVDGSEMLEATEAVPLAIDSLAVVEQFSAPEKVENLDLIHISDPVEDVDTTQPIPESETALVGDTYHQLTEIPRPKNSESPVEKPFSDPAVPNVIILEAINHTVSSFLSPYLTEIAVVLVVLKHRWRWKEEEDAPSRCLTGEFRVERAWAHWARLGRTKLIIASMVDNSELPFECLAVSTVPRPRTPPCCTLSIFLETRSTVIRNLTLARWIAIVCPNFVRMVQKFCWKLHRELNLFVLGEDVTKKEEERRRTKEEEEKNLESSVYTKRCVEREIACVEGEFRELGRLAFIFLSRVEDSWLIFVLLEVCGLNNGLDPAAWTTCIGKQYWASNNWRLNFCSQRDDSNQLLKWRLAGLLLSILEFCGSRCATNAWQDGFLTRVILHVMDSNVGACAILRSTILQSRELYLLDTIKLVIGPEGKKDGKKVILKLPGSLLKRLGFCSACTLWARCF